MRSTQIYTKRGDVRQLILDRKDSPQGKRTKRGLENPAFCSDISNKEGGPWVTTRLVLLVERLPERRGGNYRRGWAEAGRMGGRYSPRGRGRSRSTIRGSKKEKKVILVGGKKGPYNETRIASKTEWLMRERRGVGAAASRRRRAGGETHGDGVSREGMGRKDHERAPSELSFARDLGRGSTSHVSKNAAEFRVMTSKKERPNQGNPGAPQGEYGKEGSKGEFIRVAARKDLGGNVRRRVESDGRGKCKEKDVDPPLSEVRGDRRQKSRHKCEDQRNKRPPRLGGREGASPKEHGKAVGSEKGDKNRIALKREDRRGEGGRILRKAVPRWNQRETTTARGGAMQ